MEIQVVKTPMGLKPAFDSDYENFKKLPSNEVFEITYTKKRNIKFHRKFFALVKMVFDNQERYSFLDDLRADLTIEAGYFYTTVNIHGEEVRKPKSISFAQMDELEFSDFYNSVVDVIVKYFHFDKESIAEEVERYF